MAGPFSHFCCNSFVTASFLAFALNMETNSILKNSLKSLWIVHFAKAIRNLNNAGYLRFPGKPKQSFQQLERF